MCNTVLFEWFLSETGFHIEARGNLEMAFLNDLVEMNYRILWCFFFCNCAFKTSCDGMYQKGEIAHYSEERTI